MPDKREFTPKIILSRKDYKLRQKILSFLFFLLLSFIFWLFKILDNYYTTNLSFPVEFVPYRVDMVMVGDNPKNLTLNVTGQGYTLVKKKFAINPKPIVIQMLVLNLKQVSKGSHHYYAITHPLKEYIQRQLGTELTLNFLYPDTLWFNLSPITYKKVKVIPNVKIKYVKQHMLEGDLIVQPDSIEVKGPITMLDTLSAVYTEYVTFIGVFRSFTRILPLIPIHQVSYSTNEVSVTIPVEKFTQASLTIPIKTVNVPDSIHLTLLPSKINVEFLVSLKNYKKINPSLFSIIVDYKDCIASSNKLPVRIDRSPYMIKNLNYYPRNVEYLIEHKKKSIPIHSFETDTPLLK